MTVEERTARERFWDLVCAYRPLLGAAFVFNVALLVLTAFTLGTVDRDTGAFVISVVNLGLVGVTCLGVGYCLWRC